MVDYQTISIVLTGIGMIIALTYYALQIRNQNTTRKAQFIADLMNSYGQYEGNLYAMELLNLTWESFDDWQKKYGRDADPEIYAKAFTLWQFFNGVGLMLKDGLIPVRTIYEYMGFSIIIQWTKWEMILTELRERGGRGRYMEWFEYLYKRMIDYENQHPELKT